MKLTRNLDYVLYYLCRMTDHESKKIFEFATDKLSRDNLEELITILESAPRENFQYPEIIQLKEISLFLSSGTFKEISAYIVDIRDKNEKEVLYWLKLYTKSSYRKYIEEEWLTLCDIVDGTSIRELRAEDYNTILITTDSDELTSKSFLYSRIEETHSLVLLSLYKTLYGPLNEVPFEINGFFKEIVKWRLEHNK